MNTSQFLEAVRNQDTKELAAAEKKLADDLLTTLSQTSAEFHGDMLHLLGSVTEGNDLEELVSIIHSLEPKQRIQLIALITTGDATDEFMKSLDTNPRLQKAVDIAFAAHIGDLHDLGRSLNDAQECMEREKDEDADTNS